MVERGQDAGSFFVREERGKSQAGVVINGDVERLCASAWIAVRAVAGGADARLEKAAKLFNIKMEEFTGSGAERFCGADARVLRNHLPAAGKNWTAGRV